MQPEEIDALVRTGKRRPLYVPDAAHRTELGRAQIERLIPHRDPMLLVDRIDALDLSALAIAGRRRIDPADPIFAGHFPGNPVYPGVLLVEAIGQLGLCLCALADTPRPALALKIHHAAFVSPARPGDELVIVARRLVEDSMTATCVGQILVGDTICCVAIMEVYFVEA